MSRSLRNLLCINRLFLVIKKANTLLLHHPLDRLLNLPVVECEVNILWVLFTNLLSEFLMEFHAYFFHDFEVGPLGNLWNDFTSVLVVQICFRFPSWLLKFVLGDLLIKDLFEELVQVFLCHLIVKLTSMWLYNIASTWWGTVGKSVVLWQLHCVFQHFFMLGCWVFQTNKSFRGWSMSFIARALPIVLFHYLIEVASGVFVSLCDNLF